VPSRRYRGVCDNAVTIRQNRLEEQLLAALEQRLAEIQRQTTGLEDVRRERRQLQAKAERLTDAIADASLFRAALYGHS
jgi:DNA repair exonuclease SbcCD ATPase subunit